MNDVTRRPPPAARPGGTDPVDPAGARPAGAPERPELPDRPGRPRRPGRARRPGCRRRWPRSTPWSGATAWSAVGRTPGCCRPCGRRTRRTAAGGTRTAALVRRYGGEPVPTEASYELPFPVPDRRAALRLAVHLEEGAAAAWRYAVAATDDRSVRRAALAALTDAAVRATRWRLLLPPPDGVPATVPFPGGDG